MNNHIVRIATRKSPLAMQQTNFVKSKLLELNPKLDIAIIPFQTQGDKFLNTSLSKIGGKGLFVKELENALLNDEADFAVHSMKDVPYALPSGLTIGAILKREDAKDALISRQQLTLADLPFKATIGTSSLRRACQLKAIRNDFIIEPLRGNINTRLSKLDNYDAIILAVAGLKRMNFEDQITEYIDPTMLLPAAGQGALGIECRNTDYQIIDLIQQLTCSITKKCVEAERGVIETLQGSCQVPLAAYAYTQENILKLSALIAYDDGSNMITAQAEALIDSQASILGQQVAKQLIEQGARHILDKYSA